MINFSTFYKNLGLSFNQRFSLWRFRSSLRVTLSIWIWYILISQSMFSHFAYLIKSWNHFKESNRKISTNLWDYFSTANNLLWEGLLNFWTNWVYQRIWLLISWNRIWLSLVVRFYQKIRLVTVWVKLKRSKTLTGNLSGRSLTSFLSAEKTLFVNSYKKSNKTICRGICYQIEPRKIWLDFKSSNSF